MKFCTTCGSTGRLQMHHVAGRNFHPITTPLCLDCHYYCTIAGTYERVWNTKDVALHLRAGILDVWNRFAQCNEIPDARGTLINGELQGLWTFRPCGAMAELKDQNSYLTLPGQLSEILRLVKGLEGLCSIQTN